MSKLLTPNDLASKPDFVVPVESNFDYATQKNLSTTPLMTGMGTPTFNGTQTFDFNGRPSDSDQDNDRSS
jgi:hypothetical protein